MNEFINEHIHYMILTSFAIPKNDEMLTNREDIVTKWFPIGLEPKILDKYLRDDLCTPGLKKILNSAVQ